MRNLLALILIGILCMCFNKSKAQWWKPDKKELYGYGSIGLSGISYAFNQAINHHQYGKGNQFIDIKVSWKNKYKDYDNGDLRAAYIGSKTWLVWTTDLSHLSATLDHLFLAGGVFLLSDIKGLKWYAIVVRKIVYPSIVRGLFFETVFKKLK